MDTLTSEQAETFLSLWERVIEYCGAMWRHDMEVERSALWSDLPPYEQTRNRAKHLLTTLGRELDKHDDDGRDLARALADFGRSIAP